MQECGRLKLYIMVIQGTQYRHLPSLCDRKNSFIVTRGIRLLDRKNSINDLCDYCDLIGRAAIALPLLCSKHPLCCSPWPDQTDTYYVVSPEDKRAQSAVIPLLIPIPSFTKAIRIMRDVVKLITIALSITLSVFLIC